MSECFVVHWLEVSFCKNKCSRYSVNSGPHNNQPGNSKTNKITCAPTEDSDQPMYPHSDKSLCRVSVGG